MCDNIYSITTPKNSILKVFFYYITSWRGHECVFQILWKPILVVKTFHLVHKWRKSQTKFKMSIYSQFPDDL